jgi:hypothetical protein
VIRVALAPRFPLAAGAVVWRGCWIGIGIAIWTTMLTELVPEGYLARVVSLDFFGSFGLTPFGCALVGAIAGLFTPAQIIAVGGSFGFLLWLMPFSFRSVRAAV